MVDRVDLGTAAVTRVVEWRVDQLPLTLFPQTPTEAWDEVAEAFTPTFWDAGGWRIAIQTWVVEVDGLTVLVDTGVGNDRDRPAMPPMDHLTPTFWPPCSEPASTPDAVDVVVNTHLHTDHVGWNTTRDGDSWVPTFPNARYLIPEADYRFFGPDNAERDRPPNLFEDSVLPVDEEARCELWSDDHRDQRVAAAACRAGSHARLVGAVAERGQARGVRRRSHPLPDPDCTGPPIRARSTWIPAPPRRRASGCSPRQPGRARR